MALEEHLCYSGGTTEVPIYLERRVSAEHIWIRASSDSIAIESRLEQVLQQKVSPVAIVQPCPEVYLPSPRPARALVTTPI